MNRYCGISFFLLLLFLISGCNSSKKVTYLQTDIKMEEGKAINLLTYYKENIIRFQPDDILGITVNVPGNQSIAFDYNMPIQPSATTNNSLGSEMSAGMGRQTYQINKEGEINFPILGWIKAAGYTKEELEESIKGQLKKYMIKEDPIVVVTFGNFKIFVFGEVNRPGMQSVPKDRINILEAIALAGDLTIYGKRDNVKLTRQFPNGEVEIVQLNLNKMDIVSSPYFYLSQNDMIYVEPNKARASSSAIGASTSLTFTIISTLVSLTSFVILLTNKL